MAGTLSPIPGWYITLDDGTPAGGYGLYTLVAGTSTPLVTYTDADLMVAHANPIVIPADGIITIFRAADNADYVLLSDPTDITSVVRTYYNVQSVGLATSAIIGSTLFCFEGNEFSPITSTSYPAGATLDKIAAGTTVLPIDSANLVGTYALRGELMSVLGVTVSASLVNLSQGSPDTPIVTITSTDTTGEIKTSTNITFAASGVSRSYAVKVKVSSGTGYGWGFNLVRTS